MRRVVTGCRDDRVMLAECEKSSDRVQGCVMSTTDKDGTAASTVLICTSLI